MLPVDRDTAIRELICACIRQAFADYCFLRERGVVDKDHLNGNARLPGRSRYYGRGLAKKDAMELLEFFWTDHLNGVELPLRMLGEKMEVTAIRRRLMVASSELPEGGHNIKSEEGWVPAPTEVIEDWSRSAKD